MNPKSFLGRVNSIRLYFHFFMHTVKNLVIMVTIIIATQQWTRVSAVSRCWRVKTGANPNAFIVTQHRLHSRWQRRWWGFAPQELAQAILVVLRASCRTQI